MRRTCFAVLLGVVWVAGCSSSEPLADERHIIVQMETNTPVTAEYRATEHCAAYGRVPRLRVAGAEEYEFDCVVEGAP